MWGIKVRRAVTAVALAAATCLVTGAAGAETKFRISVDTGPLHFRNQMLAEFLRRLNEESGGELKGELFESGVLYASRDEPRAVARGDVDMTVTYNPSLSTFLPNMNLLDLPLFSGRSPDEVNQLVDGEVGQTLASNIEEQLGVVVPGRWLLLGFVSTFGTGEPLDSFADLKGKRIRVPGGAATIARFRALGAEAIAMPFNDVPLALTQGTIDGLLSTNETVRSAKLFEAGVTSAFNDQVSVYYYIPLVNARFWDGLSDEHKTLFADIWNDLTDDARTEAMSRQNAAAQENQTNGVKIYQPSLEELAEVNALLAPLVDSLAKELDVDAELVAATRSTLGH